MIILQDPHQRKFETLRVSLIAHCNFQCVYCTMASDEDNLYEDHRPQQPAAFFVNKIKSLHQHVALKTVRLTGGEPLLYKELPTLIGEIKNLGIEDIRLTSNGFLLAGKSAELKKAGLNSVNISLDAIDEAVFHQITGRNKLSQVLKGIDSALNNGISVKLNAVIMKGKNEDQILPLLEYAHSKDIPVRFLEFMGMGYLHRQQEDLIFTQQEILAKIMEKYSVHRNIRQKSATANYWHTDQGHHFGVIANESVPFCSDCNRLRLDSNGNLYGCLSVDKPLFFEERGPETHIQQILQQAMNQKQLERFTGSALSMLKIGG